MEGNCKFNEAQQHNGQIPLMFQITHLEKIVYFSGMLNARHTGIVGKWGNTSDCSDGFFAIHR